MIGSDGEVIRIVGTLADVTDSKTAEERLLHDAVHDNLTGLPNRAALLRPARSGAHLRRPGRCAAADRARASISTASSRSTTLVGLSAGDSILLTLSRRLGRLLQAAGHAGAHRRRRIRHHPAVRARARPDHRLRRHGPARGDDADHLSRSARSSSPPRSASRCYDPQIAARREEVLQERRDRDGARASAMAATASRSSGRPCARDRSDRLTLESDLRQALDRDEIKVLFKPIVRLEDRTIAGFESMLRWDHPRLGRIAPEDFMPIAEETGLIVNLERLPARAHRRASSRPGRTRSRSSRRSSPASTCRAASSCATTCCTT